MPRRERLQVLALAGAAALRILLFSAAFPFYTNVDEQKHVDMVLKYARGYLPRPGADAYEPETGDLLGMYGSPEYLLDPQLRSTPPPPWRRPHGEMVATIQRAHAFLAHRANKEASQPPVYYAIAGAWLRLGRGLGLEGGQLLYWLRGLNALAGFALVWLCHLSLRRLVPGDALPRWGVPILLVVFPQDCVYYVTRDALSPLLGALPFFLALRLAQRPQSGVALYAAAGACAALACLAKYTNVALLPALALCTALAWRRHAPARRRALLARWALCWALCVVPVALWLARNQLLFGDPTATALKVSKLGWKPRPFAEWWDHPLFTPSGLFFFVTELIPTYWRGELAWHRHTLASRTSDLVYLATSLLFVGLAAWQLRRRDRAPGARLLEGAALVVLVTSVALLGLLSLMYEFTETSNPPASHPFFVQGRLIAGSLVPFLVLYLRGLQIAAARLPLRAPAATGALLAAIACVVAVSELALSWPVFRSGYNWFHLP